MFDVYDSLLDDIEEHSLEVSDESVDHDTLIMIQAHQLMNVGYLEYEAAEYGTAYLQEGEIYYYICDKEETMNKFLEKCLDTGVFTTPVKYFYKRFDLLEETVDEIEKRYRLEVARVLQDNYSGLFFEAISDLIAKPIENEAFQILLEITEQLDSCFDVQQLGLFKDLLEMLLRGRHINRESYEILKNWLAKEYSKFIDEIMVGKYKKQYSGFAYQNTDGKVKYYQDACSYMTKEKQIEYISQGYIVTPILLKNYYQISAQELNTTKACFEHSIKIYLDDSYVRLMQLLKKLPPSVDPVKYFRYQKELEDSGKKLAINAFRYYGALWNVWP